MTGRTHLSFGIITAAAFSTFVLKTDSTYYCHPIIFTGLAALGSLAPDLDHEKSILSNKLPILSYVVRRLCGCGKEQFNVNRTYPHDVVLMGILGILAILKAPILLGFFFGYWGHLFLDALTYKGDSYLYFFFRNKSGLNFKGGRFYLIPGFLRVGSDSTAAKVLAFFLSIGFAFLAMRFGNGLMNYDDVTTLVGNVSGYFQSI